MKGISSKYINTRYVARSVMALIVTAAVLATAPRTALAGGGNLPPLAVSKGAPATIKPGEIITYDITITETAGKDYHRVDITEVLPPYLTYVSGSSECGFKNGRLG